MVRLAHVVLDRREGAVPAVREHDGAEAHEEPEKRRLETTN